jgi:predicted dehydrogenase
VIPPATICPSSVILMPVLNFRFAPIYLKAKEVLGEGAIGKPVEVTMEKSIIRGDDQCNSE